MQRAVPMVSSEDAGAAADWLIRAFGFIEVDRIVDGAGLVSHVELDLDGARVMIGWPGPDYRSPKRHASECEPAAKWMATPFVIDGVLLWVDDVRALVERARGEGGVVLRGPEDLPFGTLYTVEDPEGHRWMLVEPSP
jgi:uncharacterized glyoxalase superfamily protein PhnB